uniref:Transmembrane protein n=1 Tax=viral metagenome TaxID=1070528 RepID=A0A6C0D2X6_9ZZZZ
MSNNTETDTIRRETLIDPVAIPKTPINNFIVPNTGAKTLYVPRVIGTQGQSVVGTQRQRVIGTQGQSVVGTQRQRVIGTQGQSVVGKQRQSVVGKQRQIAKHDYAEYLHIWESLFFLILITAAIYLQYTSYIYDKDKKKMNMWFLIELGVYGLSGWVTFGWIRWMRNAQYNPMDYWIHSFMFVIITMAMMVCLEIGTVNNIFVETNSTEESISDQKKEESLNYQKNFTTNLLEAAGLLLWSLPILILLLRFIKGWGISHYLPEFMIQSGKTPFLSIFYLSFLGTVGMILLLVFRSRTDTIRRLFLKISGFIFCVFFTMAFLYLLYQSVRLKKDQIKSYYLDRIVSPWRILFTFLFEIIIASFLTSLPLIMTAYFRNIQFGSFHLDHLFTDTSFWKEFAMFGGKILVILIFSQFFGVFDNFNQNIIQLESPPGTVLYSRPIQVNVVS